MPRWHCIRIVLSFLWLGLVAGQTAAQERKNTDSRFEVFAQFGGSFYTGVSGRNIVTFTQPSGTFPLSQSKDFSKTGRLFAGIRYRLSRTSDLEASYSYSPSHLMTTLSGFPLSQPGSVLSGVASHYALFNYVRKLPSRGRFQIFLTAGAGAVVFEARLGNEAKFAVNFGGGGDFRLNRYLNLRIENRFYVSGVPRQTIATGTPDFELGGTTLNTVPSVGLVIRF